MKVKIGNLIYDSNDEPIMLMVNKDEKELIGNMSDNNDKFCSYPENTNTEVIKSFMEI